MVVECKDCGSIGCRGFSGSACAPIGEFDHSAHNKHVHGVSNSQLDNSLKQLFLNMS